MKPQTRAILVLAAAFGAFAASCATPPDALELADRPGDFMMAVTVYLPADPAAARPWQRSAQPARYVLQPDGVLHVSRGPGAGQDIFPPPTRQLLPRQVDQLWRLVRGSPLLDAASPARVVESEPAAPAREWSTAIVFVSYAGVRTTLRVPLDRAEPEAVAAERLVERLAELAWINESADPGRR